ncbi:MAG TPA: hypothetical protein VHN81_07445 [Edaphobacter sp.]|nr:hypothetical protein [Edaphobacter sp.]
MESDASYESLLPRVTASTPLVAEALVGAAARRAKRLAVLAGGMRLRGLEELLGFLDAAKTAYASDAVLESIAFLIDRVRADFVTAIEASLSGYQAVAADTMRDVMEIEALLTYFAAYPEDVSEWLTSDSGARRKKFAPVKVREKLEKAGISPWADDFYAPTDYKAHSEELHVNPSRSLLRERGLDDDGFFLIPDIGFMEMFEHGQRIVTAIELLRLTRMPDQTDWTPLVPGDDFMAAHERTAENQTLLVALVEAPEVLQKQLGRDPSPAETLRYMAAQLRARGPRRYEPNES